MIMLLAREKENPSETIMDLYGRKEQVSEEAVAYFVNEPSIPPFLSAKRKLPFSVQCHFYQRTFSVGEWENPYTVEIHSTKLTTFMKEMELKATDKATIKRVFEPFLKYKYLPKEAQTQLIDYLNDYPYDFIRLPNRLKTPLICRLMTSKIEDLKAFSPYHFEEWLEKHKLRFKETDLGLVIDEDTGLPF